MSKVKSKQETMNLTKRKRSNLNNMSANLLSFLMKPHDSKDPLRFIGADLII